jgi:hypothetical protein
VNKGRILEDIQLSDRADEHDMPYRTVLLFFDQKVTKNGLHWVWIWRAAWKSVQLTHFDGIPVDAVAWGYFTGQGGLSYGMHAAADCGSCSINPEGSGLNPGAAPSSTA